MAIRIETPPALKGDQVQQLAQIYSFLFRLSENLNVALNNLNSENFSSATALAVTPATQSEPSTAKETANSYNELRALINNTASIVKSEMTALEDTLSSKYTAVSEEWGEYQENITSTIEETARGVVTSYGYDAKLSELDEAATGFSEYKSSTEGYIRQGFIDYDDNNVPIIGIAIGQGLTSTTVTIDGVKYQEINKSQSCAFYTAEKVSFRVNGQEVAYVSNRKLYIGDVEITGAVILGGKWMITTDNGLKIKWIGGNT